MKLKSKRGTRRTTSRSEGAKGAWKFSTLCRFTLARAPAPPYSILMNNTAAQIKILSARITNLYAELAQPLTATCGPAAKKCIKEDIAAWEAELERVRAA